MNGPRSSAGAAIGMMRPKDPALGRRFGAAPPVVAALPTGTHMVGRGEKPMLDLPAQTEVFMTPPQSDEYERPSRPRHLGLPDARRRLLRQ